MMESQYRLLRNLLRFGVRTVSMKLDIKAAKQLEAAQIVTLSANEEVPSAIDVRFNTEIEPQGYNQPG